MPRDAFPTTLHTWIGQKMDQGPQGRAALNRHVMQVYAWPLQVYFLGSSDRRLGEPEEVVQGFFADRLARADFFGDWLSSGLKLRRWLMNAFCLYLMELRRRQRRDGRAVSLAEEPITYAGDPELEVDRAFVVSIVRHALGETKVQCARQGLAVHWDVFVRHHYDGQAYKQIETETGIVPARAAVMVRTVTRKFRSTLRELLGRDGAPLSEIDREIQSLMEVVNE